MSTVTRARPAPLKKWVALVKPGIVMGNTLAASAGFFTAASLVGFSLSLFFAAMVGLALVMASGCVFNNYIDRFADKKMNRTAQRALATGEIAIFPALLVATVLGLLGMSLLTWGVSPLVAGVAAIGFIAYVIIYSFVKHLSPAATLLGSIAGAVPPLVGYLALRPQFDLLAGLLFLILVAWQMPHFYAIACYRQKEYGAASIPVLPIARGLTRTLWSMVGYIIAFTFISFVFIHTQQMSQMNFLVMLFVSLVWMSMCLRGFATDNIPRWGRKMFRFSLVVINVWFVTVWVHFMLTRG